MGCVAVEEEEDHIPVIDFSNKELMKAGSITRLTTSKKIREALEENGCFVVKYELVTPQLCQDIFNQSKNLFDLPLETKMKNTSSQPFRGYIGPNHLMPLYEGLAIDDATSFEQTHNFTNTMWPTGNNLFCDTAHSYASLLGKVDEMAIKMVFESYGIEKQYESFASSFSHLLRFIKYKDPVSTDNDIRLAAHTDKNFTTIVHQNNLGGLEVQLNDGNWISLDPKPSHFLFMAGDAMKVWSNDRIKPCYHRVKLSSGHGNRHSFGLFNFNNGEIRVPEELVDEKHPLLYKPFDHRDYIRFYVSEQGKKCADPLKAFCGI